MVVATENVALGLAHLGHTLRKTAARKQIALAVPGVLPEVPLAPGRSASRFAMVIRDPEPAIRQDRAVRRIRPWPVPHRPSSVFAAVKPGRLCGARFDSLNERD